MKDELLVKVEGVSKKSRVQFYLEHASARTQHNGQKENFCEQAFNGQTQANFF